jgi:HD-like signal output (HDOD) protein
VASVSQAVAERTKISPDEAFLTGLLHGIGRLYIMVRAVGQAEKFGGDQAFLDLIADWHASIGKAVLENWGFAEQMCNAVADQDDHERRWTHGDELSDILAVSVVLAAAMKNPSSPPATDQIRAFQNIGLTAPDCAAILTQAKHHLGSLHDALGG